MNNFCKEGGASIRIIGILNSLASRDYDIVFMSNCIPEKRYLFHPNIQHIPINYPFSRREKGSFQFLLSIFPLVVVNLIYAQFLNLLKNKFQENSFDNNVVFFEYLDNSIAYWLHYNKIINRYIDDLHGIAPVEFEIQRKMNESILWKLKFYIKEKLAKRLDKKQYSSAGGFLFASNEMHRYFLENYPGIAEKQAYILPFMTALLDENKVIDENIKSSLLKKLAIKDSEKLILFAGSFKVIDGVPDLIEAFYTVSRDQQNLRLILIGDGPTKNDCQLQVKSLGLDKSVIFVGRISYEMLSVFQDLAHIIVCPNRQNLFSELIIHVKYLDALASGKVVIGGAFKSVMEINRNEELSLLFKPSDIDSLTDVLRKSVVEYEELKTKYQHNICYIREKMTYSAFFNNLNKNNIFVS